MTQVLTIQTADAEQPEKAYACEVLLREMLGIEYRFEYASAQVARHILLLPNGASLALDDCFRPDLLTENCVRSANFASGRPALLPDFFAATFFLLTRWEETHSSAQRDAHGRFPASQSLAAQHGFLDRPVVNEWADHLWQMLVQLGWQGARPLRKFRISLSCDVDHPRLWWSAADRAKTLAGAIFRRGDFREAGYWLGKHIFRQKDPYDVFEDWLAFFEKNNLIVQFNFMGERLRSSDCWYPLHHPFVKNLMEKIVAQGHGIGFHPSYEAFDDELQFRRELDSLRLVSPLPVTAGRQHYLRFAAPKTWQMWESAGMLEDSTLGYAEAEGFRCGICHDFPVFDTGRHEMLNLREKPLLAMDVTLAQYRNYSPQQAAEKLAALRRTVEKHGGDFTLLWHNSSWNTPFWVGWQEVLLNFIAE